MLDGTRAYLSARAGHWSHTESLEAAHALKAMGGFGTLRAMTFSRGGGSNALGYGAGLGFPTWWPGKLSDPWWVRAGGAMPGADYWRNGTAQTCLEWYQVNSAETRICVRRGEGDDAQEQDGHPLARLAARPNRSYTATVLWNKTWADLWILGRGNAYWKMVRDGTGEPNQLWHIPAVQMMPWRDPNSTSDYLTTYRRTVNGRTFDEDPRDILHFRLGQDPNDELLGFSPLYAVEREVALLNVAATFRLTILNNHGVPSYALVPKDDTTARSIDKDQRDELERIWVEKFTGENRNKLPFIPNFMMDILKVSYSPAELDITSMMDPCNSAVCGAFLLDPAIVGLPVMDKSLTYTNKEAARAAGFNNAIIPVQALLADQLTLALLPEFSDDESLYVGWDYSRVSALNDERDKIYTRNDSAIKTGWMAPNEGRVRVGLPKLPDLDTPKPVLAPFPGWGKDDLNSVQIAQQQAEALANAPAGADTLPGSPNSRPLEPRGPGGTFAAPPKPLAANGNGKH